MNDSFLKRLCDDACNSHAVHHPYLTALRTGDLPNIDLAFKDFAHQYGAYSSSFITYLNAVIQNLSQAKHREVLLENLSEEQGGGHEIDLPPEVLASIEGVPHRALYRRFQTALGVDAAYLESTHFSQAALTWRQQFLKLCQYSECVGIGAIGIGTELIVSKIYDQILAALMAHSDLSLVDRVFFDLHRDCDDQHGADLLDITRELAINSAAREQIEYGVRQAIELRVTFWDNMLQRAQNFPAAVGAHERRLKIV